MAHWIRFERQGQTGFGTLDGEAITVHDGDMFEDPRPTGETVPLADVEVLTPCVPSKMICLWNNFHALAARLGVPEPPEPLYFLKSPSAFLAHGETIRRPPSYSGNVVYEGELGIVIGKRCSNVSEDEAGDYIFGYTCVDDVTAADIISKDSTFAQWARAKSFDTFGVFGPVIATGLDPMGLSIRTVLDGKERQNYPVSDMIFPPHRLVSHLSRDMTLLPGDVIACGTSVGVSAMRAASNTIEVSIEGIGTLSNTFVQQVPFRYAEAEPKPMRVCVVGAGAIGGLMAAKLAGAGHPVTVIDQGVQLAAIRKDGLKLVWEDGTEQTAEVKAAESAAEAGPQDLVILAVKAHFLDQVVREIDAMLGARDHDHDGPERAALVVFPEARRQVRRPQALEPRSVGHPRAQDRPGAGAGVRRLPGGASDGARRDPPCRRRPVPDRRARRQGDRACQMGPRRAGLGRPQVADPRRHPLGDLAQGLGQSVVQSDQRAHATRPWSRSASSRRPAQLAADMMREAQAVAEKLGIKFRHTIEKRIEGAEGVGAHKTSMLQDVELGRSLETEALVGSILELARLTDTPAPSIQAVYACVKLLNKVMLLEGGGVRLNKAA